MSARSTYLFAGGGTGGHLFPGVAVVEELQRRDPEAQIVFVGSDRTIESMIVSERGFEHRVLPVEPLPTLKRNPLRFALRNWQAWRESIRLLKEHRPTAVIGLGGFASAPLVLAAHRFRIPIILLEQNVIPGRTTRWLSRFADEVCVSFEQTISQLPRARRVVVTGNPIRAQIAGLINQNHFESGIGNQSSSPPELLILGGSQGADSLNDAVLTAIRQLGTAVLGWRFVHQSGPRQVDRVRQTYQEMGIQALVEPFFQEMASYYSNASLVISRAGATTLAELACVGVSMILLPYPYAADDHQRANAQLFVDRQAAVMVAHTATPDGTAIELSRAMTLLLYDAGQRRAMGQAARQLAQPDAARKIADVIVKAIEEKAVQQR